MEITQSKTEKPIPVTILHLEGALDGANYECLIEEAQKLFTSGVRDLILDLGKLSFISSAGLGALHQVALVFRGKNDHDQKESWGAYRWAAYRSLDRDHARRRHEHVKLLSPSSVVQDVLDMIGFSSLFDIYPNLPLALGSFQQAVHLI